MFHRFQRQVRSPELSEALIPFEGQLRHELYHLEDKLSPEFGYSVQGDLDRDTSVEESDGDQLNMIWDVWLEGRIFRTGKKGVLSRPDAGFLNFMGDFPKMEKKYGFEDGYHRLKEYYDFISKQEKMSWSQIIAMKDCIRAAIPLGLCQAM